MMSIWSVNTNSLIEVIAISHNLCLEQNVWKTKFKPQIKPWSPTDSQAVATSSCHSVPQLPTASYQQLPPTTRESYRWHPIRSRGAAAWKCQLLREVARALIRPRLSIEAASCEPAITLMSASSVSHGTRGRGRCGENPVTLTMGEYLSRFRCQVIRYAVCDWLHVASKQDSLQDGLWEMLRRRQAH